MIAQVAGVVLAGGKSSRFGSNKALALHQGTALIQTITRRLAGLFPEILLITNSPEAYDFLGWPMAADRYRGCGPLAGIHAALQTISQPRAFVCGCDMPLLNPELIRFLCELPGEHEVVLPWLPEGPEPLYAVYSKKILPIIEDHLAKNQYKIGMLYEKLRIRKVTAEEILQIIPDLTTFQNINHQHDLARLAGMGH
ncbi:molybdenum cofactor guanylyltransferase [Thiovibrio frasassiensis]|uniref:Probable molybdenum cofactor guanylyltransferase n=1 Tax=Thiovibrio frasassiensis TaxID=2984131 RepID=A0A9X4MJ05_9BACT|nr:molybdenum cofactor guanylyltransferase [Thiovibrio frasassiensis]MDG4475744.1 molybdenum cofactor guanylyltransferase [Thiovibrio frasassiensis]